MFHKTTKPLFSVFFSYYTSYDRPFTVNCIVRGKGKSVVPYNLSGLKNGVLKNCPANVI